MAAHRINLDPDVVLEWLLDNNYVEETSSASNQYRISVNEDDYLPYSITFLSNRLSKRFSKNKLIATNKKVWKRELFKCFEEYGIHYDDRGTRGNMHWEFKMTTKIYLEQKLHIDLDLIHEFDRRYRREHKGGIRYTSYYHQQLKRYGEERALQLLRRYFDRRMQDIATDLRTKRLSKSEYQRGLSLVSPVLIE